MKRTIKTASLALMTFCMASGFTLYAAAAPDDLFTCTTSRNSDNNIVVDFKELQVTLPAGWSQKCQINTENNSASFYQIKSRRLYEQDYGEPAGGFLFEIAFSETADFLDNPSYSVIGSTTSGYYYVSYPTDVQGYVEDEAAMQEYMDMSGAVEQTVSTISIKPEYAVTEFTSNDDYILPQSSTAYISENDLKSLTGDQIQMAINEIYARHHRKFILKEVQDYFNGKSWYEGYVEAADFDVSYLNSYESTNIDLMVNYMSRNGIKSSIGASTSE